MLDHVAIMPEVNAWSAQIAADESAVCACVDWFMERYATLADVLLLYAGTAPEYVDGLDQRVVAKWCEQTEPKRFRPTTNVGRGSSEALFYRWQAVQRVNIDQYDEFDVARGCRGVDGILVDVARNLEIDGNTVLWDWTREIVHALWQYRNPSRRYFDNQSVAIIKAAVARARRWLKRQVLALFPEVMYGREVLMSWAVTEVLDIAFARRMRAKVPRNHAGLAESFPPPWTAERFSQLQVFRKDLALLVEDDPKNRCWRWRQIWDATQLIPAESKSEKRVDR